MHGRSSNSPKRQASDPLSEVLQDLRLSRASYCRSELSEPWGLEMRFQDGVRFHFVAEGSCWLLMSSREPLLLNAGDVVLLPHGTRHVIADRPQRRGRTFAAFAPERLGDNTYRLRAGGSGRRSLVVCCTVGFDDSTAHLLIELMPDVLLVRAADVRDNSLRTLLEMMAAEVEAQRIGAATVMTRLADIIMTLVVRTWIEGRAEESTGWLAAIREPRIGKALAAIHMHPADPWSVEALAKVARLSRSSFSGRFQAVLGISPAHYVARWRMHLASAWLRNGGLTVAQVAARLGYESDASFSRAFKRILGVSPGKVRSRSESSRPG